VAVTPCGPGPSHRVLAVEPCAPTPITIRWCRRRPEALAQRPLDDASDHDAARQVEADDESRPPVDDFLDVVRAPSKTQRSPDTAAAARCRYWSLPSRPRQSCRMRTAPSRAASTAANVDLPLPVHPMTTIRSAWNAWAAAATTPCCCRYACTATDRAVRSVCDRRLRCG